MLADSSTHSSGSNDLPQETVRPVWLRSIHLRTAENIIGVLIVWTARAPIEQRFSECSIHRNGLAGCFSLEAPDNLIHDGATWTYLAFVVVNVITLQCVLIRNAQPMSLT